MVVSEQSPDARRELIQKKAYELYLQRGGAPGHEMEDWLAAEKLVAREQEEVLVLLPEAPAPAPKAPTAESSAATILNPVRRAFSKFANSPRKSFG